jgi:hypothetical protein
MASPIETQLIAGNCYWDTIGANWFRLVTLPDRDVIGHYKFEYGWLALRAAIVGGGILKSRLDTTPLTSR